ncbi:unnamed protein product [Orchesella dallaii]|uniref:Uncharacterized protein n=1 Tax=Orchesella dallaii TaxID=48710 RepID=A0ABP1Q8B5_9HEXA
MKSTTITAILGCAIILVSLHSAYGFPTETEDEPGKMSTGWGSGSGWGNAIPTNGTSVSAAETIILQNVTSFLGMSEDANGTISSTDGTGSLTIGVDFTGYADWYSDLDPVSVDLNGTTSNADNAYVDADLSSELTSNTTTTANASNITFSQDTVSTSEFNATSITQSNWAYATNGTNMGGSNSDSGWGWSKDETVTVK